MLPFSGFCLLSTMWVEVISKHEKKGRVGEAGPRREKEEDNTENCNPKTLTKEG